MIDSTNKQKIDLTKLSIEALILSQNFDQSLKNKLIECTDTNFKFLSQSKTQVEYAENLNRTRKEIINLFELLLGQKPHWIEIRRKLLFSFGDRCLGQLTK